MRIGLFTDTYRPSVNGIVYVVEILRRNLETLGHEVFIFAPAASIRNYQDEDDHIIRFPAFKGAIYDDYAASLFFPSRVLKRVKELELDIIHFVTPGQVGLMGVYAASKTKTPLVAEYCTDLFQYAQRYPSALPGILALGAIVPFTIKLSGEEILELMRASRPRSGMGRWSQELVRHLVTVVHSHSDAVIAHSRKTLEQLESWETENPYPIHVIPTGIDALPKPTKAQTTAFRQQWDLQPDDEMVLYVGRLSVEKNLDILIDMMSELIKWRPHAKLMYVGDFDYRETLEQKAKDSPAASRIIFTGTIPREQLGSAYASAMVFVFPSLTDTQGLVVHEAAQAGLPIVLIDEAVTEIVKDGKNGYICQNDAVDMAAKVRAILEDPKRRAAFAKQSKQLASKFSESKQSRKIANLYESLIAQAKAKM